MTSERGATIRDYEGIIKRVKDVVSARVVADETGEPIEIHVLARLRRSAKQVVRDIESAMLTTFGLSVDPRRISVAQIRDRSEAALRPVRIELESLSVTNAGHSTDVRVTVRSGETIAEGQANCPRTLSNRLRVVAAAAVTAASRLADGSVTWSLSELAAVQLGGQQAVVVSMSAVDHRTRREIQLLGSAFVQGDEREAAVRAVIDAVNRQFPTISTGRT